MGNKPKEIMFDPGLWQRVRKVAFESDISGAELVRRATRRYLAEIEEAKTAAEAPQGKVLQLRKAAN